jgi:hypothetical protein
MDFITLALIVALPVVAPPVAVWWSLSRPARGVGAWLGAALALLTPFVAAYFLVVILWLADYQGQCGGWLGETTRCRFGEYASETLFWAASSMAVPGFVGIALGITTLIFRLVRRRVSRNPS